MSNTYVVVEKILAMFLVILIGWLGRRRGYVDATLTRMLSTFTTDVALPCLIFAQMLRDVNREVLLQSWIVPVLAAGVLLLGQIVGWLCWRGFCTRRQAPTFIFVVSITNWIYLPLPIVEALWGSAGVRSLLICNVGVQVYLWTVGIATLHGGKLDRDAVWNLVRNPGLIATIGGIAVALLGPFHGPTRPDWAWSMAGKSAVDAMAMIGSLTIPLSLLVTGAQLGALSLAHTMPTRPVMGTVILRLLVTPLVALAIALLIRLVHLPISPLNLAMTYLISTMPVAVSCGILAERFNQDVTLAAQSILYTTVLSILTVPVMFALFNLLVSYWA